MSDLTSPLLTDLYQLTMLAGYFEQGMNDTAVFEFHARSLPDERNFLVACGQEAALDFLEQARFDSDEIDWLRASGRFNPAFVDWLADWRFTGEVRMLPEGSVCFPHEPIFSVIAPLAEAQLVESRLINILHLHTLLASKAARCVLTAPDRQLVDFGMRRAHGAEAAMAAAWASYVTGFAGTATVLAGRRWDIPLYGTMAHSFIEAHDDELEAFTHFAHAQPDNVVLLIDTYDTEQCAARLGQLAPRLAAEGIPIKAVRLDSGDLTDHACRVRRILDAAGLDRVGIFASGDVDEYRLRDMISADAPIDGFGVGTRLDTSADAPYLDCAYKLTEYAGRPRRKRSEGKLTWPGRKQVWRRFDAEGNMMGDTVDAASGSADGQPLTVCAMRNGQRVQPANSAQAVRDACRQALDRLPPALKGLESADYPVAIAPELKAVAAEVDRRIDTYLNDTSKQNGPAPSR